MSSPHFSSGIVERAKRERTWKSPHARKVIPLRLAFLALGDVYAHSRFARSTIPEGKWGTTRSLAWLTLLETRGPAGTTLTSTGGLFILVDKQSCEENGTIIINLNKNCV